MSVTLFKRNIIPIGVNSCPWNSECRKIKYVYKCAEDFCNSIWDESFYVPMDNSNSSNCVSFTFNTTDNPNRMFENIIQSGTSFLISSFNLISFSIFNIFIWLLI